MKRTSMLLQVLFGSTLCLAQSTPVHHWPLDAFGGTHAPDITGGADGILINGATWVPGQFGTAVSFDGGDDRVDLGDCDLTSGPGDEITLALSVRPALMTGAEQILLAKTTGPNSTDYVWSVSQVNSTALRFRLQGAGTVTELTTTGSSLFSGAWYHVAAVYDGSEMRIYLNAALMAYVAKTGALPFAPYAPATMGDRLDGDASFMGTLDDVRIYDHALSEAEIIDLVIGNVSVGLRPDVRPWLNADGDVILPPGEWQHVKLIDSAGRIMIERDLDGRGGSLELRDGSPGIYLVCLQDRHRVITRPLVVP